MGEPDANDPSKRWLGGYELATRMSYFLNGTTPDVSVLDFVAANDMRDVDTVRSLAQQMLLRDEARQSLSAYYSELFRLRELDEIGKDATLYPQFGPALAWSMQQETLRLIDDIVWNRDADMRELFTADYTFVDDQLAGVYGVDPPGGFVAMSLPPEQRRSCARRSRRRRRVSTRTCRSPTHRCRRPRSNSSHSTKRIPTARPVTS